jgi:hypothetical protein
LRSLFLLTMTIKMQHAPTTSTITRGTINVGRPAPPVDDAAVDPTCSVGAGVGASVGASVGELVVVLAETGERVELVVTGVGGSV